MFWRILTGQLLRVTMASYHGYFCSARHMLRPASVGQPCKVIFTALTTPVYREGGGALGDHTALSDHQPGGYFEPKGPRWKHDKDHQCQSGRFSLQTTWDSQVLFICSRLSHLEDSWNQKKHVAITITCNNYNPSGFSLVFFAVSDIKFRAHCSTT